MAKLLWAQKLLLLTSALAAQPERRQEDATFLSPSDTNANNHTIWRFPLHENSGTQHLNVWLGQGPSSKQTWIVDTGSRFTATMCSYCPKCGGSGSLSHANDVYPGSSTHRLVPCGQCQMVNHHQNYFNNQNQQCQALRNTQERRALMPYDDFQDGDRHDSWLRGSSSDRTSFCHVTQQYTEGSSWSAWEINEIVSVEGAEQVVNGNAVPSIPSKPKDNSNNIAWDLAVPMPLGCQTDIRGLFRKQYADGILGLERSSYNFVAILAHQKLIPHPSFRLCLHPKGGWFSVGHSNDDDTLTMRHHQDSDTANLPRLQYTPSPQIQPQAKKNWYNVQVEAVWLGNQLLVDGAHKNTHILSAFAAGKATILDSGTTDTFLPAALAPILSTAWKEQTNLSFSRDRTHDFTWQEFQQLPEVHLLLANNVTWTIAPRFYMEHTPLDMTDDTVQIWAGTKRLTNRLYVDEPAGAVLGLNAFMGYEIDFRDDHMIGIAAADCHA